MEQAPVVRLPDVVPFAPSLGVSMAEEAGDITLLLQQWQTGSRTAENDLFALVMPHLRRLAHHMMKGERQGHSLQATELVDQIYFRMIGAKNRDWQNRD